MEGIWPKIQNMQNTNVFYIRLFFRTTCYLRVTCSRNVRKVQK